MKKVRITKHLFDFVTESPEFANGVFSSAHLSRDGIHVLKKPLPGNRRYTSLLPSLPVPSEYHEAEIKQFQFMQQHPEIFVKIARIGKGYMVSEKLTTYGLNVFYKQVSDAIFNSDELFLSSIDSGNPAFDKSKYINAINKMQDGEVKSFGFDYVNLVASFLKLPWREYLFMGAPDIHPQNIGYDKEGKLKIFDF